MRGHDYHGRLGGSSESASPKEKRRVPPHADKARVEAGEKPAREKVEAKFFLTKNFLRWLVIGLPCVPLPALLLETLRFDFLFGAEAPRLKLGRIFWVGKNCPTPSPPRAERRQVSKTRRERVIAACHNILASKSC